MRPSSKIWQMFAWFELAAIFASSMNILMKSGSSPIDRQDPLDRDDLLEALDAEGLGLEDLGHAADADAIEQEVFPEWDRLPQSAPRLCPRT